MTYTSPYKQFIFEGYMFDSERTRVVFSYSFDGVRVFEESVQFEPPQGEYSAQLLDRCLQLAFIVVGTSYYKTFPTTNLSFKDTPISQLQAEFINSVYSDGLSQFVYENNLEPSMMPNVVASSEEVEPIAYQGRGVTVLQSGGKDSLLLGTLLNNQDVDYDALYVTANNTWPSVIAQLTGDKPRLIQRRIDKQALSQANADGGLNGHVPVTYITLAYALIDAVLHGNNTVLAAIGNEGDEPNAMIGDFAVNHQWSKTWSAEKLLSGYVADLISGDIRIGSPLRSFSELRIAELFAEYAWDSYKGTFSSCNLANYKQDADMTKLTWCGRCPKCVNTYLLFSPFVEPDELRHLFNGVDLFTLPDEVQAIFKGLLGLDGYIKPLECVGEVDELRLAYHMARRRFGVSRIQLPFDVPESDFPYRQLHPAQTWAERYIPNNIQEK